MLKLKNNIVPLNNPMSINGLAESANKLAIENNAFRAQAENNSPTSFNGQKEFLIKVNRLPESANDQLIVNTAIKDLHKANTLDRNQVSNGEVTFQELLDRIAALEKENNMHKGRLDTIRNVSRYDI